LTSSTVEEPSFAPYFEGVGGGGILQKGERGGGGGAVLQNGVSYPQRLINTLKE